MNAAASRLTIAKLMLSMVRQLNSQREHFGSTADELLLCKAVLIGHLEGRPMTAAKLAAFAGVPRATAVRKLKAMAARGHIERAPGGTFVIPAARMNCPEQQAVNCRVLRLIRHAMDKMDRKGLAALFATILV